MRFLCGAELVITMILLILSYSVCVLRIVLLPVWSTARLPTVNIPEPAFLLTRMIVFSGGGGVRHSMPVMTEPSGA